MRLRLIRCAVLTSVIALTTASCGGSAVMETAEPSASHSPGVAVAPLPAGTVVSTAPQPQLREAIGIGMMSGELVVETADSILVLEQATGTVTEEIPMPDLPRINGFLLTDDALWILDHDGGTVVRVDPSTGEVVAEIAIGGAAVSLLETPDGIWAGSANISPQTVSLIDPATNAVTRTLELGAFPVSDGEHLWFGRNETGAAFAVRQVDPATGEIVSSIDLEGAEGCYLGGRFPDVVWSWCFEPPPNDTDAARLDLATGSVSATVPLGAAGALVGVHENASWFFAEPPDGSMRLLKVSNETNAIDATYAVDGRPPMTMVEGMLLMIDTASGSVVRVSLADL